MEVKASSGTTALLFRSPEIILDEHDYINIKTMLLYYQ